MTDDHRCPIDGAPLQSWTEQVNGPSTYVHVDGTTHGGLLEFAEHFDAAMANLRDDLAPIVAELNTAAGRMAAAAKAIEWPKFPLLGSLTEH